MPTEVMDLPHRTTPMPVFSEEEIQKAPVSVTQTRITTAPMHARATTQPMNADATDRELAVTDSMVIDALTDDVAAPSAAPASVAPKSLAPLSQPRPSLHPSAPRIQTQVPMTHAPPTPVIGMGSFWAPAAGARRPPMHSSYADGLSASQPPPSPRAGGPAWWTWAFAAALGVGIVVVVLTAALVQLSMRNARAAAVRDVAPRVEEPTRTERVPPSLQRPPPEPVTFGFVRLPRWAASHRIFVDGKLAGQGAASIMVPCGEHVVRIGEHGPSRRVPVPCGGEVSM
jgi:hypothetical protein